MAKKPDYSKLPESLRGGLGARVQVPSCDLPESRRVPQTKGAETVIYKLRITITERSEADVEVEAPDLAAAKASAERDARAGAPLDLVEWPIKSIEIEERK